MSLRQALVHALLQSLWQLAAIGLLAQLILVCLRRATPALRHAAGMVALLSMLALPGLTLIDGVRDGAAPLLPPLLHLPGLPPALQAAVHAWAPALWASGACAILLLQARALVWLRALERRAAPLPPEWQARLDGLRVALGIGRQVTGKLADGLAGPFTARVLRPVIWLPAALLTGLAPAQVEALLAHELAHIRRLDWLSNGLQCLAEALLFHHPAVWWLGRELRRERELACDRLAVGAGIDPLVLAGALHQTGRAQAQVKLGLKLGRMVLAAGGGELAQRVASLLGAGAPQRPGWRRSPMVALLALLALLLVAGSLVSHAGGFYSWRQLLPPAPPAAPAPPMPPAPPFPPAAPL